MTLSHQAREERRRAIADKAAEGVTVAELQGLFGVSRTLVETSCQQHGVVIPQNGYTRKFVKSLTLVAELLNTGETLQAIGERYGLSRQRICQVLTEARDAGIEFPHRKRMGDAK